MWFGPHYVMVRGKGQSEYTVIRTSNGTKVGMFPAQFKIIFSFVNPMDTRTTNRLNNDVRKETRYDIDNQNYYASGIVDWEMNKVFSPTLASLVQLGAYDLCILREDKQALSDECNNHFPEDFDNKLKLLGPDPFGPILLRKNKLLLEKADEEIK